MNTKEKNVMEFLRIFGGESEEPREESTEEQVIKKGLEFLGTMLPEEFEHSVTVRKTLEGRVRVKMSSDAYFSKKWLMKLVKVAIEVAEMM